MEYIKQSMNQVWASAGDVVMPDNAKIQEGWLVEVPPRQYWNWMQNRADTNLAYIFQRGIPEWDNTVEYIANRSFVVYNGVTYKAILTGTNQNPSTETAYWSRAFSTWSAAGEAVGALTPSANTYAYFTGASTAALGTITSFARSILDDATAGDVRSTIGAQQADATLTAIADLTTSVNKLPYFTGTDTAALTDLTAFGRSLIDDNDAASARLTLGLQSGATTTVGTIATQNANSVVITGGSISGITDLAIADGGTGASDAAGARLNLGLGTAAVTNVTTSQTDATAGRVVKVGDFGENGGSVLTGASGDFNTYTSHGFWIIDAGAVTITNSPDNLGSWILEVRKFATTSEANGVVQVACRRSSTEMWQRSYLNTGWTQWSQKVGHQMGWQALDLNFTAVSGFYNIDGASSSNLPMTSAYGHLIVHNVDGNTIAQKFIIAGDVSQYREYSRVKSAGTWQPWYQTWTSSNQLSIGTTAASARSALGLGTAATSNVQTGATDATSGRVLTTGAFGLGGVNVDISGSNLNDIGRTGFYRGSSLVNAPSAEWWYITHQEANGYATQEAVTLVNTGSGSLRRTKLNGVWSGWTWTAPWSDSGYIVPTFVNGFTDANFFRYRKLNNVVYIAGTVARADVWPANTALFTLPSGFRPANPVSKVVLVSYPNIASQLSRVIVYPDGTVMAEYTASYIGTPAGTGTSVFGFAFTV